MSKGKTLLLGLMVALAALAAGIYTGQKNSTTPPQAVPSLANGSIERLFASTLTDTNGKPQAFAQWKGKTLVVNFWATWCPPCREEMPAFSRLQTKHAANGVQFVGIALDSPESVQAFAKQTPVTNPLLNGDAEGTALAQQLGNARLALPYTLVIAPSGEASFARLGGLSEQELDAALLQTTRR
jgi:thiol-disulfide isomerase/thioredoxin